MFLFTTRGEQTTPANYHRASIVFILEYTEWSSDGSTEHRWKCKFKKNHAFVVTML